jgi:hypothetical protein
MNHGIKRLFLTLYNEGLKAFAKNEFIMRTGI